MARSPLVLLNHDDELRRVISKCNENFNRLSNDLSLYTDINVRREGERADARIDQAYTQLQEALAEALDLIDRRIEEINELADQLEAKFTEMNGELDDLRKTIADLSSTATGLRNEINELDKKIVATKSDLSKLTERVVTLEADVSKMKTDLSSLKTDLSSLTGKHDVLQTIFNTLSTNFNTLHGYVHQSVNLDISTLSGFSTYFTARETSRIFKRGRVCMAYFALTAKKAIAAAETTITLPAGYRPVLPTIMEHYVSSSKTCLRVSSGGNVAPRSAMASGDYIYQCGTWVSNYTT